ncbi:MAG: hypothetical protein Q7S66_03645 [bacterium]|nr:hypothetical protein [bacterium]
MKKVLIGFLVLIVGVIALFTINPGNIFTPWLMKISRGPNSTSKLSTQKGTKNIPYSTLFTVKKPKPVTARTVSARMTVKDGGTVKTTDAKGTVATLYVPAGALSKDATISISPLQEIPIENFSGALSNGVVIEPEGLNFKKNAQLTFEFKPMKSVGLGTGHVLLASNENPEDILKNLTDSLGDLDEQVKKAGFSSGLPGVNSGASIPAVGGIGGTKAAKNTLPKQSAVIHVDHKTGRVNIAETTRSIYGSKITAAVTSLSSFPVVNLGGPGGGNFPTNDLQNGAAAAGGACTPDFINAMLRVAMLQQAFGGSGAGDATAMQAVEDCAEKALEEMERRCKVDTIHVTRREMFALGELLMRLGREGTVERWENLMQSCKRIYSVSADADVPVPEGKTTYGFSAQLCGYLDEQWVGTEISDYKLIVEEGWVQQVWTGEIRFTLPHGGGQFQIATRGNMLAIGRFPRVNIPDTVFSMEGDWQIAEYDGNKQMTVFYNMYGHKDIPLSIEMTEQPCESTNEVLNQMGY